VQRDGMVIYIGMLERYNAYKHTKSTDIFWNILCVYSLIQYVCQIQKTYFYAILFSVSNQFQAKKYSNIIY
jgi:hypothetical protein